MSDVQKEVGSVVIDSDGDLVLLAKIKVFGDLQANGSVPIYDEGILLRGSVGRKVHINYDEPTRVVSHVRDVLKLLEASGADLQTRPEKPIESLDPIERLARAESEIKKLQILAQASDARSISNSSLAR